MNLLMVRHGEIASNIEMIYAGKSPERLNSRVEDQAIAVAEKLNNYNVCAIFSSLIARAFQTAEIIGKRIRREVVIEDAFREIEIEPWEGMSEIEAANIYPEEWDI